MAALKTVHHHTKKIARGTPQQEHATLAVEEPLEIRVNHEPVKVMMRTPGDDFDLVAGFLYSEGAVHTSKDISAMRYVVSDHKPDDKRPLIMNTCADVAAQKWTYTTPANP